MLTKKGMTQAKTQRFFQFANIEFIGDFNGKEVLPDVQKWKTIASWFIMITFGLFSNLKEYF